MNKMIQVEVAYARPDIQRIISLEVEEGSTVETAILRSGILEAFPEIDLTRLSVGIFSKPRLLSDQVFQGDRVEIYRPLMMDPKEARRRKARGRLKR